MLPCYPTSTISSNITALAIGMTLALSTLVLSGLISGRAFAFSVASYETEASESKPSGAKVVSDPASSGGKYLRYTREGTATKQGVFAPEGGATGVTVRAKAKPSGGVWPELEVFVDGLKVGTSGPRVNSTSYAEYSFEGTIPAGTHTVGVRADEGMQTNGVDNSAELHADVVQLTAPDAPPTPHSAKSTDDFINSIGVQAPWSFLNSPYGTDYLNTKALSAELGVKHQRAALVKLTNNTPYAHFMEVHDEQGVDYVLNVDDTNWAPLPTSSQISQAVVKMGGQDAVFAFEGTNEYNNDEGATGWQQRLETIQCDTYSAVKGSNYPTIPVIAAPLGTQAGYPAQLPELGPCSDLNSAHAYPGGNHPTGSHLSQFESLWFDQDVPNANAIGIDGRDIHVTETGYSTAPGSLHEVSDEAKARYVPRLHFECFNAYYRADEPDANFKRCYYYQLRDHRQGTTAQDHFGLVAYDGTRKPAFQALENTIDILEDPGPAFATSSLDYTLLDTTPDIHQTLLQKRDGTFYLALWREVRSYDKRTDQDISVTPQEVTVQFSSAMKTIRVFDPTNIVSSGPADDAETHPSRQLSSVSSVTEPIGDQVKIIEVTEL